MQVAINKDEVSESESEISILRPPDEREVNRIKPNPSLKVQPVFVDPGRSVKPVSSKQRNKRPDSGLCLEITGRVQHNSNDLINLLDNQLEISSTGELWPGSTVNGASYMEDDIECN